MKSSLNKLGQEVWKCAHKKGAYWDLLSPLSNHALIITEVAEATEAARRGELFIEIVDGKPEGEVVELADALMRIAGYCAAKGYDLDKAIRLKHAYNLKRPSLAKEGKKL